MKKKWRVLAIIGGAVALVVVGAVFYANREHPDYVRAAKLLPAARLEAEAMFGPLTWEEYRAENGISGEVDLAKWEEVAASIPTRVKAQIDSRSTRRTDKAVFREEREWFDRFANEVGELRFRHILMEGGEEWELPFTQYSTIVRALTIGIVGAADEGDADAVLVIGRASNNFIAALNEEPALISEMLNYAFVAILNQGILQSAVRNRDNPAVLQSIRTVLKERMHVPTIREVMSAQARSMSLELNRFRTMSPRAINDTLNEYEEFSFAAKPEPRLQKIVYDAWERITGERPTRKRKTGRRTAAALEARYWEVLVKYTVLFEQLTANEPGTRKEIVALADFLENTRDRSYEIAPFPMFSVIIDSHIEWEFDHNVLRTAVALIERYPDHADVPEALPADLSFADPFGGDPVIFRKTPRGFLIYSRYVNESDDGFPPEQPDQLGTEASIWYSLDRQEYGLIVSYDPIVPVP
ncbi:MAG: hypothetical protein IH944_12820 [Armatimonadetes bacterium]|nr:hypothetical protein [Armatimonadota bacterium]